MFDFKERLNFICSLKDNDLKVKHISQRFLHFGSGASSQGSGIRGQKAESEDGN